jgi:hypothetical protein
MKFRLIPSPLKKLLKNSLKKELLLVHVVHVAIEAQNKKGLAKQRLKLHSLLWKRVHQLLKRLWTLWLQCDKIA